MRFSDWVVYQIYPRSFLDSNGDGIGDLAGITQKLDYLCSLGVNAVWLCPCYKSPDCDNGYDISDYRNIDEKFGTFDDWKTMLAEMHKRGIRLIMDFVANHTSSQHRWFLEASKCRQSKYHDYYIWAETPPNDWQSCFGGSAWQFNPATDEYYLHTFAVGQPDLNWENPDVRREMCDILDYWVDLGVDGFRCDVLDCISKDFATGKMSNGPNMHRYIRELFDRPKTRHLFTVGECASDEQSICKLCGSDRGELSCVFQFDHFNVGRTWDKMVAQPYTIDEVRNVLVRWQNFTQKNGLLYPLFTDNHDQSNYISRLGNDGELRYQCATMYATMFYLLRGVPFVYQGQEYGAAAPHYDSIAAFADVETLNYYKANLHLGEGEVLHRINFGSRDNVRRPFCWNDGKNFGFGEGRPWIPLHSRGAEINLQRDRESANSVFEFYRKLLAFRRGSEAIKEGVFEDITVGDGYFAYVRRLACESVLVVCNFQNECEICGLPQGECVLSNYSRKEPNGAYRPFEAAVFVL